MPDWREMPCELWHGTEYANGYGYVERRRREKTVYAHVLTWEECFGPVPHGMSVLHHCDVKMCRQPLHLFVGTQGENVRDMIQKGRHASQVRELCRAGHPLSGSNLISSSQSRRCRQCASEYNRRYRDKKRDR